MANIKFSQFTEKTTLGTVDFLVGYTGAENVQISPTNLLSTFVSGSGTNGQVAYFDPSNNLTGENDFFWDYTNNRLGIGTSSPSRTLHVKTDSGVLIKGASGSVNAKISLVPASGGRQYDLGNVGSDFRIFDSSAGVTRMYFDNNGNTGIGTTTPSSTLQISGTLDATGISQLGSGGSNVYLTSSSAGNVGIGTSSPSQKLAVTGNIGLSGSVLFEDNQGINFGNSNARIYGSSSDGIKFNASGSEAMRLNQSGNVGIGTTSPSQKLEVVGNIKADSTGNTQVILESGGSCVMDLLNAQSEAYLRTTTAHDLHFRTTNINRMVIKAGGNVGIGTAFPTGKLEIQNEQVTTQFDRDCFLRLHPSATTDAGGFTNMFFGTSTVNNYGVAIGGLRAGTGDGEPSFSIRMLDDAITGTEVLRIDNPGNATFAGTVSATRFQGTTYPYNTTVGHTANATTTYIEAGSSSKTSIELSGGDANSNIKFITPNASNVETLALTIDTSQNATFTGNVDLADNKKLQLGASQDLKLYHDGSHSIIQDSGTGVLKIITSGVTFQNAGATANTLVLDSSGNATFAGDVIMSKNAGPTLNMNTNSAGNTSKILLHEGTTASPQNGASIRYDGSANAFKIGVGTSVDTTRLTIDRDTGLTTFAGTVLLQGDGGNAQKYLAIYNEGTATHDDVVLGFKTHGSRQYSIGIDRSTTNFTLSNLYASVSSGVLLSVDNSGNAIFTGDIQVGGWVKGVNATNTLYSATSLGTYLQSPTNSGTGSNIYFRNTSGTVFQTFSQVAGGTSTFAGNITVSTASATLNLLSETNGNSTINFADPADNNVGQIIYRHNGNSMAFDTNDVERMRIDSSGNASIGSTTNAGYRLKVEGTGTVQLNNRTGSDGAIFAASKDGAIVGSITVTSSATAFNTSSDYRLKEDLQDFAGLDMVSKISVYDFKWKADESRSYGVMAHELQEVLPQAVTEEKDAEEMQGVDYSKIVPLLVKSIQELKSEIEELKSK